MTFSFEHARRSTILRARTALAMAALFWFSMGHFIAVIELVTNIAASLKNSGGSASEYQGLACDLTDLQAALAGLDSP